MTRPVRTRIDTASDVDCGDDRDEAMGLFHAAAQDHPSVPDQPARVVRSSTSRQELSGELAVRR